MFAATALLLSLVFVRCEGPVDGPDDPQAVLDDLSLYDAFKKQFDGRCMLAEFNSLGDGAYRAVFSDGRGRTFGEGEVPVITCRSNAWPVVVPGGNGEWYVNGKSTGIPVAAPDAPEDRRVVAVMYDTDEQALYVRLASGRMFFFHTGKVLDVGCFRFETALNPSLSKDIICTVGGALIAGTAEKDMNNYRLVATVAFRGTSLMCDNQPVQSSVSVIDYSAERAIHLRDGDSGTILRVRLSESRRIPKISISTGGKAIQRDTYVGANMRIEDPDLLYGTIEAEDFTLEIKGRGNSTWGLPKKPYKLKLSDKKRLLGMSNDKHWVLLANYSDKSLLRNELAFELSRIAGMHWTPRSRPVELYLNGSFQGQYMLTEHVRVAPERVNLEVVDPSVESGDPLTGGYFLWIDSRALDEKRLPGFRTKSKGLPVVFEDPEAPGAAQKKYVEDYFNAVEQAIYNRSFAEYSELIDIESCIQYFFVQEIAKNVDGDMRLSTYMWKPYKGKLGFPCVWDFDIAFGNCNYNPNGNGPTGWHIRDCTWIRQLFRNQEFVDKATEEWRRLYPELTRVEPAMREWAELIDDAQKRNFEKWPILGKYVWPNLNAESRTTYRQELDYMLDFFNQRIRWMNTEIEAGRLRKTN